MRIVPIITLPPDFDSLVMEADADGHGFLRKMKVEWDSGVNRFDKCGEVLFVAIDQFEVCSAIGGLNVDFL